MTAEELTFFNQTVNYLTNILTKNGIVNQDDKYFTIDSINIVKSGCGTCGISYPSICLLGNYSSKENMENSKEYKGTMDTWNFYTCKCEPCADSGQINFMLYTMVDGGIVEWDRWFYFCIIKDDVLINV
jgi:hypothetical protein